jgi:DNA-binding FadR family transcriptional regulator
MTKARTYPRRGLHGALVHDIGVRILRGDLRPGDTVPVDDGWGDEPAVSRTVLREVVKVLAAKGLVESRPKTGTRVRPRRQWNLLDPDVLAWQVEAGPDEPFLEAALERRRLIEPAAARLAAERATDEEIAALEAAHEGMEAAGENLDLFMEPDLRFHTVLLEASHNELLEHMAGILTSVLRILFSNAQRPPGAFGRAAGLHGAVVDAIVARDPDAAEAALLRLSDDTAGNVTWALERGWVTGVPAADG